MRARRRRLNGRSREAARSWKPAVVAAMLLSLSLGIVFTGAAQSPGEGAALETGVGEPGPLQGLMMTQRDRVAERISGLLESYGTLPDGPTAPDGEAGAGSETDTDTDNGTGARTVAHVVLFGMLFGLVHVLLPGHRALLPVFYFIAEDAEWHQGVFAGLAVALLQTTAAFFFATASGEAAAGLGEGLQTLVDAVYASGIARLSAVLMSVLGLALTVLKLRDGLQAGRHFQEERILGRLKSVSDEIDPNGQDPAREMIVQHRREGRRRRYRGAVLFPSMLVAAVMPAPGAVALMSGALERGHTALGIIGLVGYALGAATALTGASLIVMAVKNGGLALFRARTAQVAQVILQVLGAASILALAVSALNAAFGMGLW